MLTIGTRLTPVYRPGVVVRRRAVERDALAIALHRQLLEIRGKALQVLVVGQDRDGLSAEEIGIPDTQESQQYRQVGLEGRRAEVLVDLVEAVQHGAEMARPDRDHRREPDR